MSTYIIYRMRGPRENENYKNKSENLENNLIYKHTSLKTELNVLYTNADGLLNNRHELKIVLNSAKVRPNIIAITEILPKNLAHQLLVSEFELEGYNIFCSSFGNKKEY